uniref:C2H2-type domain-containing protein n=1 Tax=Meloidogyne javanica TaxID=6303 RepID=A0A915LUK3_MELJA
QNAELFNVENTKTKDQQNGDALMLLKGFLESVAENNDGMRFGYLFYSTSTACIYGAFEEEASDIRPISQEEKHKLEIQMWGHLCFPEWKQKPQKRKYQTEEELTEVKEAKKEEVEGPAFQKRKMKKEEKLEEPEEDKDEEDDGGRESITTTSAGGDVEGSSNDVNDRLCHLCMEESKYPGRHIAQRHLNQPLYECPVCFKFGSYESCTVVKHIKKVHPEASDFTPISNLEKYADQIRDLQARCFPNRQMKLVRPLNAIGKSRPRERHHCGMCGADVAQSDRQRHVYHKHLRKGKVLKFF